MKKWLLPFFTLLTCHSIAQPYKNLVLEGGGIRGIAYAGALKTLEEQGALKQLERVAGTSVGSIVAALIAVGYSADDMRTILDGLKMQQFNDGRWFFLGGMRRTTRRFGWYRGERLEAWMGQLIAAKTGDANTTLSQLHQLAQQGGQYKDLYALATNLTLQRQEVLSYTTYPDMSVKAAVRASLSIPLYFGAVFIDSAGNIHNKQHKQGSYQVLVDGGIVANYPLTLFDTGKANEYTLGLKLERPEQIRTYQDSNTIAPYRVNNIKTYIAALYNVTLEQLNKASSFEEEKRRTIYISTGNITPRVKRIPQEQKERLYNNGKEAAKAFLKDR